MRKLSEIITIGLAAAIQLRDPATFGMCCILARHLKYQEGHNQFTQAVHLTPDEVAAFNKWIQRYLTRKQTFVYLQDAMQARNGRKPTKQEWITWYRRRANYLKNSNR